MLGCSVAYHDADLANDSNWQQLDHPHVLHNP